MRSKFFSFYMLASNQLFVLYCIAVICNVLSFNASPKDKVGNEPLDTNTGLMVVSDDEMLPGSHFEARRREFTIGSFNISIKQNWRALGLGCVVWPAAVLLSNLLSSDRLHYNILDINIQDKLVVELGTGTGLPSIVAALNGAKNVIATDRKEIIERCTKKNTVGSYNELPHLFSEILDWDIDGAARFKRDHGAPDIIIGADLIYHESAFKPLVDTLLGLSGKDTKIVITGKVRYKELNSKFETMLTGFSFKKIDASGLGDLAPDKRDYVYLLQQSDTKCDI